MDVWLHPRCGQAVPDRLSIEIEPANGKKPRGSVQVLTHGIIHLKAGFFSPDNSRIYRKGAISGRYYIDGNKILLYG